MAISVLAYLNLQELFVKQPLTAIVILVKTTEPVLIYLVDTPAIVHLSSQD